MANPKAVLEKVARLESFWLERMNKPPDRDGRFWREALQYSDGIIRLAIEATATKVRSEQLAGAPMIMNSVIPYCLAVMRNANNGQEVVLPAGKHSNPPNYHHGHQEPESPQQQLNRWRRKLRKLQIKLQRSKPGARRDHYTKRVQHAEEYVLSLEKELGRGSFAKITFEFGYQRCNDPLCLKPHPSTANLRCGRSLGHLGPCSWVTQ